MRSERTESVNSENMPSPIDMAKTLEQKKRQDLAVRATGALSALFEADVSLSQILDIADSEEDTAARLTARRALRAVTSIAKEDSEVARRLGKGDMYHYIEGVVTYGADTQRYLALMDSCGLSAEEATGIYALRELIAEHTNGAKPGLQQIIDALGAVGISIQHAAADPEHAAIAFDEAGFISDHAFYRRGESYIVTRQFNQPVFSPARGHSARRLVEGDGDGTVTEGIKEGLRETLRHPVEESDVVDDNQVWHQNTIENYLKNLGS